jgi:hypothetical protein
MTRDIDPSTSPYSHSYPLQTHTCFHQINEIQQQALLDSGFNEALLLRGYQPLEIATKERFHKMGRVLRNHSHTVAPAYK